MTADPVVLLLILALILASVFAWCSWWLWLDAKERAEQRRQEAAMAEARSRSVRQARRYDHSDESRPE